MAEWESIPIAIAIPTPSREAEPRDGRRSRWSRPAARVCSLGHLRVAGFCKGRIDRRMPRMQIYLPEAMYKQVKERGLPVSELLQKAVQAELRRQELLAETDRYLTNLIAEVGAPNRTQRARAGAVARRLARRSVRKAG